MSKEKLTVKDRAIRLGIHLTKTIKSFGRDMIVDKGKEELKREIQEVINKPRSLEDE